MCPFSDEFVCDCLICYGNHWIVPHYKGCCSNIKIAISSLSCYNIKKQHIFINKHTFLPVWALHNMWTTSYIFDNYRIMRCHIMTFEYHYIATHYITFNATDIEKKKIMGHIAQTVWKIATVCDRKLLCMFDNAPHSWAAEASGWVQR